MSPKESEKIGSVYKDERKRLLGYIRNRIPDKLEAEDILQDVFYQLTVGFRDIRRIENMTAWIYKVTDNRITDLFRRKKPVSISYRENTKDDGDGPLTLEEILPSLGSTPGDDEIKDLIWEAIEETLSELPEEQRIVFVANEFEDLSFKEISEKTGVGVNTLISRKRYAVLAPVLTFWQTAGLFILSKILLTGVAPGSHQHGRRDWRKKYNHKFRSGCMEEETSVTPEQV